MLKTVMIFTKLEENMNLFIIRNIKTLTILFFFAFSACTMKYSFTGASIPPDAKTVSIENFPNMAPLVNPNLSNQLTEGLKDKFLAQTSLNLVNKNADLKFSGKITDYYTQPVAIQGSEVSVAAMNRLTVTVNVKFENNKDPKANFDTTFSQYRDYDSANNLQDIEAELIEEILKDLIQDIFNKSVVNW